VTLPADAYPGAIQAAGELARTGDLAGEGAVWSGLDGGNLVLRTIAAKQLYFLVTAGSQEARERLDGLLADPELADLARAQLDALA